MKKKKGSNSLSYFKREKSAKPVTDNKSSTTIKQPSTTDGLKSSRDGRPLSGEAAHLAEQVKGNNNLYALH